MSKLVWGLIVGGALFASATNADTIEEAVGNTVVVGTVRNSVCKGN